MTERHSGPNFESFDTPQPRSNYFENEYRGTLANSIELNRTAVERFCQIVDFNGNIYLTEGTSRNNSDSRPDNSFHTVRSIPQGWVIGIDDRSLEKHVTEQKSALPIENRFISKFNGIVKQGLSETARREWLTDERNPEFRNALLMTLYLIAMPTLILGTNFKDLPSSLSTLSLITFFSVAGFGITNLSDAMFKEHKLRHLFSQRNLDTPSDMKNALRPPLLVDNVIAAKTYLKIKGRQIVRKSV